MSLQQLTMNMDPVPTPTLVTAMTPYGVAYAWQIKAHGLMILGDSKTECQKEFLETFRFEYEREF